MSNATIFASLVNAGMTKEGACAVIGNMAAESGMKPNIAQRGMTPLSDEQYTAAADSGSIDFANDSVGYGLCQWTFHTRKAGLLSHAKARALSVGDETAQVTYCVVELMKDYPVLWKQLCSSHELYALTEAVCTIYERPAVNNVKARYDYAQQAYEYFNAPEEPISAGEEATDVCPITGNCDNQFDFGEALRYLKRGIPVARLGWNGKEQYIMLARKISFETMDGKTFTPTHAAIGNNAIAFFGTSGIQMGWLASQADMLADDWHIAVEAIGGS